VGNIFQAGATFEIGKDFLGEVLEVLESGERVIRFTSKNFAKDLEKYGASPLPPYIHQDHKKVPQYQTVYAKTAGSVAAPTAGLHFTPRIFAKLKAKGISVEKLRCMSDWELLRRSKFPKLKNMKCIQNFLYCQRELLSG